MASSTASNVYIHVIEDVICKVRDEFNTKGGVPGDNVLTELQGIWEMKMMQAESISAPIDRPSAARSGPIPVHDVNVGTEEYETPIMPLQTPIPDVKPVLGRPRPYMQPPQLWANAKPRLDVNVAYVGEEGDTGGSHQLTAQDFFSVSAAAGKRKRDGGYIPQQDGATSEELKDNVEEDDHDCEPLNEDDDDDDYDDVDQGDDDLDTSHLILAQFDKVTHTKRRWKCTLRDGIIMHINNKDILFNKATGEFDF